MPVLPLVRVVANGVTAGSGRLKATLIVSPYAVKSGVGIALEEWPSQAWKQVQGCLGRLRARRIDVVQDLAIANVTCRWGQVKDWKAVDALWKSALAPQDWVSLSGEIQKSLDGTGPTVALDKEYKPDTSALGENGALPAETIPDSAPPPVAGVVTVRHADMGVDEEIRRAMRVFRKLGFGARACELPAESMNSKGSSIPFTKKQLKLEIQKQNRERYSQAVDGTKGDREKANNDYEKLVKVLRGKLEDCADLDFRKGAAAIAIAANSTPDRSSHVYGTWLQAGVSVESAKPATSETEALMRFQALQGDALLSRLLCLAVDIEFELGGPALQKDDPPQYMHLWVEHGDGEYRLFGRAPVRTAAKRSKNSFWPVSAFEASLGFKNGKPKCQDLLIEQSDGMWNLGIGGPVQWQEARAARYDLASLDIRRSVESKQGEKDRGERMLTGGFTILDRGRGLQILRELALATIGGETHAAPDAPLVLYAEDLTIGRRVDVAAVGPGTRIADIGWRSLMHRWTHYRFTTNDGPLQQAVASVLPAGTVRRRGGHVLEEGMFQVSARHIPRLDALQNVKTTRWDVAADEAIFTWDGTPAAVLTDAGKPEDNASQQLPFTRDHDLPTLAWDAGRLPPPLRYGVPYQFSLRSVFVGGGSPTVHEAQAFHYTTNGERMLPPARNGEAAPTRFLRHESILAPTLLLPYHLARYRYGLMGHEQVDQAIIRSGVAADATAPGLERTTVAPDGAPYATLDKRALPEKTMRVFVPPEAAFEDVVRHGCLDVAHAAKVLKGGLRSVAYEHVGQAPEAEESRVSGFPRVVADQYDSLDAGGAVFQRRLARPDEKKHAIPYFHPGGRHVLAEGAVGWLPDPAAQRYSVRARIRGSHRYLDGDLRADVYGDGHQFPDALPLVLEVVRAEGKRQSAVRHIGELVVGGKAQLGRGQVDVLAPVAWLDERGMALGVTSTPVRHFRFALHEGEDFDLEIACLPCEETLANVFSLPETMALQGLHACKKQDVNATLQDYCGKIDVKAYADGGIQRLTGLAGHEVPDSELVRRCAKDLLGTMRRKWPIEELAAVAKLRVCHAINRPRTQPQWLNHELLRPSTDALSFLAPPQLDAAGSEILLLKGKIALDLAESDSFEILATSVAAAGGLIDDISRGRSLITRRTGRWPTIITPDGKRAYAAPRHVFGFDVHANGRVTLPDEQVTLLRVDNLPVAPAIARLVRPGKEPNGCIRPESDTDAQADARTIFGETSLSQMTPIELAPLHVAALAKQNIQMVVHRPDGTQDAAIQIRTIRAAMPHAISDRRARHLTLQVRALSRFAEVFETAPVYLNAETPLLRRRQPLASEHQSKVGPLVKVWCKATARPAMCDPLRPEPVFAFDRASESDGCGGIVHRVRRRVLTRLYFRRGWFSSGEGERLGIVLWPTNYFDKSHRLDQNLVWGKDHEMQLADLDDKDLGAGGAYVTRWGGDPIRKDPRLQTSVFIPPSAFADAQDALGDSFHCACSVHDPRFEPTVYMPLAKNAEDRKDAATAGANAKPLEFLPVGLLTYEPCFDIEREEWYVDVDLRLHRPSEPIVRFGLVRYQPNAINESLMVSEPTTVMMPLMPGRTLDVRITSENSAGERQVEVTLTGPGSVAIKDLEVGSTFAGDSKVADYLREFESLQRPWIRVWIFHECEVGGTLQRTPLSDDDHDLTGREVMAEVVDEILVWRDVIAVPRSRLGMLGAGQLIAYVEEVDRRMPATYPGEPIEPKDLFDRQTYLDSGPRFSARVSFLAVDTHGKATAASQTPSEVA